MSNQYARVEREIAGRTLVLETGQVARQATGSVVATYGESKVFAAVVAGKPREDIDFFPLTVDYREKTESAGRIPGGFFKREGRPTAKETITMRLIDRSIRPLFAEGFHGEVQVMSHALSYDGEHNTDVLAMIAAFATLRISGIPFHGALGAVRVGRLNDELVIFPSDERRRGDSTLDLVVAGHKEALCMVEASAQEVPESVMIDALELAHEVVLQVAELVEKLFDKAGKPRMECTPPEVDQVLVDRIGEYADAVREAIVTEGKMERHDALAAVRDRVVEELCSGIDDDDARLVQVKKIKKLYSELSGRIEREVILTGRRVDGRAHDEIRDITIVPGFVPRQHGSALFTRGETQALVSCTLGTSDDEQIIDGIETEYRKRFYLHYNFPPYSVGETRRFFGPGRREIGHGMLAERALQGVLPQFESFPYTLRIVSDILESNGSSSMASVCGGCLAMMMAGVPIRQPVAGIAMGLVEEGDQVAILSDILGSEDHSGDMDFKVAGSGIGITALQMDIKIRGITRELLERALEQARLGRRHILKVMLEAVPRPAAEVSQHAPRMETLSIPQERIGYLIGPGGSNIKKLQITYEVRISVDDDGKVQVAGADRRKLEECVEVIRGMFETPDIGARYTGKVKSVKDFGAFIEILPGVEGMCHVSELADSYVEHPNDVVQVGDEIQVAVINVDDRGKIKLSHKATLQEAR